MSLLKLPLIAIGFAACEIAYTSPNPPPKPDERISFVGHEDAYTKISVWMTLAARTVTLLLALCEMVAIVAAQYPSISSTNLLSTFIGSNNGPAITTTYIIGWTLIVVGASIRLECYRTLGRHFTFELSLRKDQSLVTHGPYSIVRHPSYVGTMLVTTGMVMCQLGSGSWLSGCGVFNHTAGLVAAFIWASILKSVDVMLLARIGKEDAVMKKEFGDQWASWAKRTPYKLIPLVF